MDFVPPRCPNFGCSHHTAPVAGFYQRRGSYRPKCRAEPVPRFRCRRCGKGFSRQTFRADYRDHRPDCNGLLFQLLVSGVGLRQAGRCTGLTVHAVQHKFRKLGGLLRRLNRNLLPRLPDQRCYLLDEIETFEHRSICPVTVPVLIEKTSKLIVAVGAASIRRRSRRGSRRQRWLDRHEAVHGRRRDHGKQCVWRVFRRWQRLLDGQRARLITDKKALYASLCRSLLGSQVEHFTWSGRLLRTTYNPLFPINLTDAMLRDNNGRLRRRSWLVTKKTRYLRLQLELFVAYRNWHRLRTNQDPCHQTPGVLLGLAPRRLEVAELLAWRQDWRNRSIHPASVTGHETVQARVA
ncbi:MAG TPA: hypothetical protein VK348_08815 [Planctomycetota bacterium]|nr:hypothetical protein [Planctomycetota bacterium]